MTLEQQIQTAATIVKQGGLIAYPCEGVYGLGCDPFNENAVKKILQLKQRSIEKGLIIVASDWQQVQLLAEPLAEEVLQKVFNTWPGPVTWVFPASKKAPSWITGKHASIALRVSDFPLIQKLCAQVGWLVSTSANIADQAAATTVQGVQEIFAEAVDFVIDASIGALGKSTPLFDVITGKKLR